MTIIYEIVFSVVFILFYDLYVFFFVVVVRLFIYIGIRNQFLIQRNDIVQSTPMFGIIEHSSISYDKSWNAERKQADTVHSTSVSLKFYNKQIIDVT